MDKRGGWKGGGPNCRTSMMQMISNAVYHTFLAQWAALYLLAQAERDLASGMKLSHQVSHSGEKGLSKYALTYS